MTLLLTLIPILVFAYVIGRLRRRGTFTVGSPRGYTILFGVLVAFLVLAVVTEKWVPLLIIAAIGSLMAYLVYLRSKAESGPS